MRFRRNKAETLAARDYKDPQIVFEVENAEISEWER